MNAIVAPNAQIAARNSRSAGISRQIAITAPKPMIPTGRRARADAASPTVDGIWRLTRQRVAEPREPEHGRLGGADEDHDAPRSRPGTSAARAATPASNASATPSSGASTQRPPVCGSTEEATSAMPEVGHQRRDQRARRSAAAGRARPIATCPASPEDASMPAERDQHQREREDHVLERRRRRRSRPDRSAPRAGTAARGPSTTTSSCRTRSPSTSTAARSKRRGPPPRIASSAT